jgi:hypothetical protein
VKLKRGGSNLGLKNHTSKFEEAKKILDEANELIEENTIDSLLRYFQTGILENQTHLPSLLLNYDLEIQIKLATKMEPILTELGFHWNKEKLMNEGLMVIEYIEGGYRLEFATVVPSQRVLKFHFDFIEMEREREIKLAKINRKIKETKESYLDGKKYIKENQGFKRTRNLKTILRIEENIKNITKVIKGFESEIKEINEQKRLLEIIKSKIEDTQYKFRRYGFILEYVKGEIYDV